MTQKQKSRDISQSVIEGVLQGDLPPEVMATDVFKTYAGMANIDKRPEIKALTDQAMEEFRPAPVTEELRPPFKPPVPGAPMGLPGAVVTVPQAIQPEYVEKGVPFEAYQKKMLEKEDVKAQRKLDWELKEFQAKEIIKDRIKRSSHLPLNKRIDIAEDGYKHAIKKGWSVDDLTIRDPESGVTVNIETYAEDLEKQESNRIAKEKAGVDYLKEKKSYYDLQLNAAKLFHNMVTGRDLTAGIMEQFYSQVSKDFITQLQSADMKTQARRLMPLINAKIKTQHEILEKKKRIAKDETISVPFLKQFKLSEVLDPEKYAAEFEVIKKYNELMIKPIDEAIRDSDVAEEKLREKLTDVDVRDKVIAPRKKKEEEETEEADTIDASQVRWDMQTCTIPETGEKFALVDGKWKKIKY